jgi:glycosyltransferase involved in cell wall biosynthesis
VGSTGERSPGGDEKPVEITIVLPVRNERASIDASLDTALAQVIDAEFEVLAVDGDSEDGTRQILDARSTRDCRLRVINNAARGTPQALNIGLRAARGRYWVRLDGHSELPPDYVQRLVIHLRSGRTEAAGGVVKGLGAGSFGRAAAAVQDSRFGIGNARHHYATETSYIDHLSHGIYRVDRSRAIGGFDEALVRNQDYDFDYRYGQSGGRILLDPGVSFQRRVRDSPARLARQFHEYGYWKFVVLRRHPRSLHLRWLAPPALTASLSISIMFSWSRTGRRLLAAISSAYLGTVGAGAIAAGRRVGFRVVPQAALAMMTMHLAWGSGFLRSTLTHAIRARLCEPPIDASTVSSCGSARR